MTYLYKIHFYILSNDFSLPIVSPFLFFRPSCPYELCPQDKTSPFFVRNKVCWSPHEILAILSGTVQDTGLNEVPLRPNCPLELSPQHSSCIFLPGLHWPRSTLNKTSLLMVPSGSVSCYSDTTEVIVFQTALYCTLQQWYSNTVWHRVYFNMMANMNLKQVQKKTSNNWERINV